MPCAATVVSPVKQNYYDYEATCATALQSHNNAERRYYHRYESERYANTEIIKSKQHAFAPNSGSFLGSHSQVGQNPKMCQQNIAEGD